MKTFRQNLGALGEKIALNYLLKQGYQFLESNYQTKGGEVDIIVARNKRRLFSKIYELVFVEVKTFQKRDNQIPFLPEDNVHYQKRERLIKTAQSFLKERGYPLDILWRIDVISVRIDLRRRKADIKHIQNAVY